MVKLKVLPKKSYSLEDAAKYIFLNHQIDISVRDLLEYIQNGELKASVYLSGDKVNINSVNRKEVDFINGSNEYRELRPYYSECSLYFRLKPQEFEIQEYEDCSWLHKEDSFLDFYICLPKKNYSTKSLRKIDCLSIYDGNVGKVEAIDFEGYFQISGTELNSFNVDYLIDKGFLESFPKAIMAIYKNIICFLYIDENKTPLYLDDICILHEHLINFLELFSVIDTSYDQIEEIQNLKNQLDAKDKKIEELKEQIESYQNIKVSTASENKKNEFIKALLKIKYGAEVAENPRPHVYDPNVSNKGKDSVIQRDFESKGLTKHLPSGKTLKNWVSSVELDN
ncbi:SlyX protein [Aggregatibacter aphrophilus]|uniref:SlyX protein n=1 Tax=Aggregatibacter aphrophilus TaxID=732 RepID=UPI000D645E62|nr:SlyX protein [Aggregatibacter aphrophilus]